MSGCMKGLIGRKLGMTQVFDGEGNLVPVTVIEAGPCVVVQRKRADRDGYDSVQLGFGDCKEQRLTKSARERFKKISAAPKRWLKEFELDDGDDPKEGETVTASIFEGTAWVDVSGVTKGRGFQGVVKRHGMGGGPMTHGGHSKRRVGSIGQCSFPARVAKGQGMPGHMGHVRVTAQNLKLVEVRPGENLVLVRGAVPGASGAVIAIRKSLKRGGKK